MGWWFTDLVKIAYKMVNPIYASVVVKAMLVSNHFFQRQVFVVHSEHSITLAWLLTLWSLTYCVLWLMWGDDGHTRRALEMFKQGIIPSEDFTSLIFHYTLKVYIFAGCWETLKVVIGDCKGEQTVCQIAETLIGVIVAGGQFSCGGEMWFARIVMRDSFKNSMIWLLIH